MQDWTLTAKMTGVDIDGTSVVQWCTHAANVQYYDYNGNSVKLQASALIYLRQIKLA